MRGGLSEEQEQIAVVQWFCVQYAPYAPWLHHSPNGGRRHLVTAKRLKSMGTKAGFPDLVLYLPRGGFASLAIEMKYGKGRPTKAQNDWLHWLDSIGFHTEICNGYQEAIETLKWYVNLTTEPI